MASVFALGLLTAAADTAGQTVLRSLSGPALVIAESAQRARVNREAIRALSRRVNETITAISEVVSLFEDGLLPDDCATAITTLSSVLLKVVDTLQDITKHGYVYQLLHQETNANIITGLQQDISTSFSVFMMQAQFAMQNILRETNEIQKNSQAMKALDDHVKSVQNTSAPMEGSTPGIRLAATELPARPTVLFGRSEEMQTILDLMTITDGPARIAILGTGGIGKTSLALSILHHIAVEQRFGDRRYFVAFDSAELPASCLATLAGALGYMGSTQAMQKQLVSHFSSADAILILDNYESAWESSASRVAAEEMLQLLSAIPQLTLIITMRGSERPHGVAWSRPLLPPLSPLSNEAARQTFVEISDKAEDDSRLWELLSAVENLPLAVVLLANLAQVEDISELLVRWEIQQTDMLSQPPGGRSFSLDTSIELSLASQRMRNVPDAPLLLGLLSLLPDGAMDEDILIWGSSLNDHRRCVSTLLQNSLAYRTSDQRIRVLAPIRAFMLRKYTPSSTVAYKLFEHYFSLAELLAKEIYRAKSRDVVAAVIPEISNLECLVRFSLEHCDDPTGAIRTACSMSKLVKSSGGGSPHLVTIALDKARGIGSDSLAAECLYHCALLAWGSLYSGDPLQLLREAQALATASGNETTRFNATLHLITIEPDIPKAIADGEALLADIEATDSTWNVVRCMQAIVWALRRSPRKSEAVPILERSIARMRIAGDPFPALMGQSMLLLAESSIETGHYERALPEVAEALVSLHRGNHGTFVGLGQTAYTKILFRLRRYDEALKCAQEAYETWTRLSLQYNQATSLLARARVQLSLNDAEAAETSITMAGDIARVSTRWTYGQAVVLHAKGQLSLHKRDSVEAYALLQASLAVHRDNPRAADNMDEDTVPLVFYDLGRTAMLGERWEEASNWFTVAAVRHAHQGGVADSFHIAKELLRLAECWNRLQDPDVSFKLVLTIQPLFHRMGASREVRACRLLFRGLFA